LAGPGCRAANQCDDLLDAAIAVLADGGMTAAIAQAIGDEGKGMDGYWRHASLDVSQTTLANAR
jgi:hypothetical protein